jgi:hypothetical protein
MIDQIKEKLRNTIEPQGPFHTEMEIIYFFVEIRKLLEREDLSREYPVVEFYSNWCLHPNITKENNILRIKPILNLIVAENGYKGISRMISLGDLKREISELNRRFFLPNFTTNNLTWLRFISNLKEVLIEQPIEISPDMKFPIKSIKYIDSGNKNRTSLQVEFYKDEIGHQRSVTYSKEIKLE